MKPVDLYNREPEEVTRDIGILRGVYYNHTPEIHDDKGIDFYKLKNERIEVRYYKYYSFDARRFWALASIYFNEEPVMIIQNAGRDGDDHAKRFITNRNLYNEMIGYIQSLIVKEIENSIDVYDENEDIENLDEFYGYSMMLLE